MNYVLFFIVFILFFISVLGVWKIKEHFSEQPKPTPTPDDKLGFCPENAPFIAPTIIDNFITEEEANHIIQKATPIFVESTIVSGTDTSIRKSKTANFTDKDPVIDAVIKRACDYLEVPVSNAEPMQVVKYGSDGFYKEHYDSCPNENEHCRRFVIDGGGKQRFATFVIYLNDQFTGGSTKFVNLKKEYKPEKFGALMFYSLEAKPDGTWGKTHPLSMHAGTQLTGGEKYIANIWIRE